MRVRLRQSDPRAPGFRRVRHGRGFRYFDLHGAPVTDPETRRRFEQLVIPPAWRDVAPALTLLGEGQSFGQPATPIERAVLELLTSP